MRFATMLGLVAVVATCGFGGLSGCGELDSAGPNSDVTQTDQEIRRHHRRPGMGHRGTGGEMGGGSAATGGSTGGGRIGTGDCSVCDRAASCCNAAVGGALCNVSASACESVQPAGREAYAQHCLVVINSIVGTRLAAPNSIPSACNL